MITQEELDDIQRIIDNGWVSVPLSKNMLSRLHFAARRALVLERENAELKETVKQLNEIIDKDWGSAEIRSLIAERDRAESYADKLASVVLNEPIDWSCHEAKWEEAIERNKALSALRQRLADFHRLQHQGHCIVQPVGGESVMGWAAEEIRTAQISVMHGKLMLESVDRYLQATWSVPGVEDARKELIKNANNFSGAIAGETGGSTDNE